MDKPIVVKSWSTPLALVFLCWLLAVVAGVSAVTSVFSVFSLEPAGRLLLGMAAVVLSVLALHGTLARPRLAMDTGAVTVRGMIRTHRLERSTLQVTVNRTRRMGRVVSTLELESGETLLVLGRLDLGADPEEVAEALGAGPSQPR